MRSIVDTRRKVSFVTGFLYAASKQNPQTKPTADVVIDSGFSCGSSGSSGSTIDQTSPNSKSTKSNDKFNYFIDKENDDIWENRISNRHRIKLLKRQLSDDLDVEYTSEHVLQNILKNNNSGLALLAHKVDQYGYGSIPKNAKNSFELLLAEAKKGNFQARSKLHQLRQRYDIGDYGSLIQGFTTAAPEILENDAAMKIGRRQALARGKKVTSADILFEDYDQDTDDFQYSRISSNPGF